MGVFCFRGTSSIKKYTKAVLPARRGERNNTMNTMEMRNLCIKNNWFTNGDNTQYDMLFEKVNEGADIEELATIIWICSTNVTKDEVIKQLMTYEPHLNRKRIQMVRAMELLARSINNEKIFRHWLITGVADGDINENTKDSELEEYTYDEDFAELMETFVDMMYAAKKHGGIYFDGISSERE